MGKSKKANRAPKRRKPIRNTKGQKSSSMPSASSSFSSSSSSSPDTHHLVMLSLDVTDLIYYSQTSEQDDIDELFEDFLEELYETHDDDLELVQDFQTMLEESHATFIQEQLKRIAFDSKSLTDAYLTKVFSLHVFQLYISTLSDELGKIIGDEHHYRISDSRFHDYVIDSKLIELIDAIPSSADRESFEENILSYVGELYRLLEVALNPAKTNLSSKDQRQFDQELKETIGDFLQERLNWFHVIDTNLLKTNLNNVEVGKALFMQTKKHPKDVFGSKAQVAETFLSDELTQQLLSWTNDICLIYPRLLKLLLKYSVSDFHIWFNTVIRLVFEAKRISADEFLDDLNDVRKKRLKAQKAKAHKQKTSSSRDSAASDLEEQNQKETEETNAALRAAIAELVPQDIKNLLQILAGRGGGGGDDDGDGGNVDSSKETANTSRTGKNTSTSKGSGKGSRSSNYVYKAVPNAQPASATKNAAQATASKPAKPSQDSKPAQPALSDVDENASLLSSAERYDLYTALQKDNPHPRELEFSNNFELLCAEIILAQSTIDMVNLVTPKLFAVAPTPKKMAALNEVALTPILLATGSWGLKAERLIKSAQILHDEYNDEVPDDYNALLKFPGIGPKGAKDILRLGFGQPNIAADAHVIRVCNRTGLCVSESKADLEKQLLYLTDPEFMLTAQRLLSDLGRDVCTLRNFEGHCTTCAAAPWCKYHKEHQ